MRKFLLLLVFSFFLLASKNIQAQCYSYGCGSFGYYANLALYSYAWDHMDSYQRAAVSTDMFFGALQNTMDVIYQSKAIDAQLTARRNRLENYNSVKRYYTEGIPPFAPIAPDGRPRSPKITWQDVESIR